MGAFDWVRVQYPIAREHQRLWFQTTSIGGAKLRFTLTRSGRLKLEGAPFPFDGYLEAYDINEDVSVRCTYAFRLVRGKLRSTSYRSEVIGDARNDEGAGATTTRAALGVVHRRAAWP
jgi:hypothetical protein